MHDATYEAVEALHARREVQAVLLFGSRARGDAHVASDFDLGVLLAEPWFSRLPTAEQARAVLDVMTTVARLPVDGAAEVDVVVLNAAHPIAAWEAARAGSVLYCRERAALDDFTLHALHRYDDWQALHAIEMQQVRGRLRLPEPAEARR